MEIKFESGKGYAAFNNGIQWTSWMATEKKAEEAAEYKEQMRIRCEEEMARVKNFMTRHY